MIQKIKNWNKLIKFILYWRKEGHAAFHISSNSEKLVITIRDVNWVNFQGTSEMPARIELYYKKIY